MIRLALALLAVCPASQTAAVDVSAELGAVSDYRYRGLSLSDGKPAAQASITFEHDSGAYGTIWSSTIEEPGFEADVEFDLTGGYSVELVESLSLDLSATYYLYPSEQSSNYVEGTATVEYAQGPATLSASVSFVPRQSGTKDEDDRKRRNSYWFLGAAYQLPKLPLTVTAGLGHEAGFFDEVEQGGKWDWSLGASVAFESLRLGVTYTGTDIEEDALVASLALDL
ncbi:MAG TPA: TorF family putative porin [Sphingomicrobium sp.]